MTSEAVHQWVNNWLSNGNNFVLDFTHEETINRFRNELERNFFSLEKDEYNEIIRYAGQLIRNQKVVISSRGSGLVSTPQSNGYSFEETVANIFLKKGYTAEVTKKSGDFGADIILLKNDKKIVVQTKYYSSSVGVEAIQQIHAAKGYYDANEAWVITNNKYTPQAFELAKRIDVLLLDGKILDIL